MTIPYTARRGFAFAEPLKAAPAGPPRCSCRHAHHHPFPTGCERELTPAEHAAHPHRCATCHAHPALPWHTEETRPVTAQTAPAAELGPIPYVGEAGDPEAYRRSAEIDRNEADCLDPGEARDACLARAAAWDELADATARRTRPPAPELTAEEAAVVERFDAAPDGLLDEAPAPFAGIPVELDDTVPPGVVRLRSGDGTSVDVPLDARTTAPAHVAAAAVAPPEPELPLPALLDALATSTATAQAVKAVGDELRAEATARLIARHAEEGTDRWRREAALVTLTMSADRTVVTDEDALVDLLVEAGYDTGRLYATTVTLDPAAQVDALADAIRELRTTDADTLLDHAAMTTVLGALKVDRMLNAAAALTAVEEALGAQVTRDGTVIADTGEPLDCIRIERGRPTGVQVRCDAELKAARLADVRAAILR